MPNDKKKKKGRKVDVTIPGIDTEDRARLLLKNARQAPMIAGHGKKRRSRKKLLKKVVRTFARKRKETQ